MPGTLANRISRPRAKIGLTSLIDVVFILLVFFMLASSFTDWRVIELSAAKAPQATTSVGFEGAMLVRVRPEAVSLGGEAMALDALEARIAARLETTPDQRVLVQPVAGVTTQRLVDVLDRLDAAGVADLSLVASGGG